MWYLAWVDGDDLVDMVANGSTPSWIASTRSRLKAAKPPQIYCAAGIHDRRRIAECPLRLQLFTCAATAAGFAGGRPSIPIDQRWGYSCSRPRRVAQFHH
jgi:hypothetical protein